MAKEQEEVVEVVESGDPQTEAMVEPVQESVSAEDWAKIAAIDIVKASISLDKPVVSLLDLIAEEVKKTSKGL